MLGASRSARIGSGKWGMAGLLMAALAVSPGMANEVDAVPEHEQDMQRPEELKGTLPDGTAWLIKVPQNWNGTLLRDLDFATNAEFEMTLPRYEDLLNRGYAFAGLARHPLRPWRYDPQYEIKNLERVQDIFAEQVAVPNHVLQYGCSGAGFVSLSSAEAFPDKIDGAVVLSAHTPVWMMNSFLDGWFAMKSLLADDFESRGLGKASDLLVANLPNPAVEGMPPAPEIIPPWQSLIEAAGETAEGRARLALAFAVGQWSPWMAEGTELADPSDANAMGELIVQSALRNSINVGGTARLMFENAAMGQQMSGNETADYAALYENAAPNMKGIVEKLYAEAGLDIASDLQKINSQPRIAASDYALEFWSKPGRTNNGDPKVPVMRVHSLGDWAIPYTVLQGYQDLVEEKGNSDLYRQVLLERTGHCVFTVAESTTAVETLMARIETGSWPDTSPEALTRFASERVEGADTRFIDFDDWRVGAYNHTWVPAAE